MTGKYSSSLRVRTQRVRPARLKSDLGAILTFRAGTRWAAEDASTNKHLIESSAFLKRPSHFLVEQSQP